MQVVVEGQLLLVVQQEQQVEVVVLEDQIQRYPEYPEQQILVAEAALAQVPTLVVPQEVVAAQAVPAS